MKAVIQHTITQALRQRYLQVLSGVLLLLFVLVAVNSSVAYKAQQASFEKAKSTVRNAWLNQGPQNPHSAAHYGHYVFQPVDALQFLDNGSRTFTGSILRLEGHRQNEAAFSAAEGRSELSRFGDAGFAWMLQVLLPLFIILLCYNAVSGERESGNLKLLAAQGLSSQHYLWGRILGNYAIVLALVLSGLLIQLLAYGMITGGWSGLSLARLTVWTGTYITYLFILTGFSVLVSAWFRTSRPSLLMQLAAWVLLLMVMPRIVSVAGTRLHPMEYRMAFNKQLNEDRRKGIDGHNPQDSRIKKLEDSLMKNYGVDSLNKLPINADGLVMQADEEYGNLVYDKHFSRIRATIAAQNKVSSLASFVNPFLAIRNLSMGLSASDYRSHLSVADAAEEYRRKLIRELNLKMAYGGSKTGDWDWKVDKSYWAGIQDFSYPQPALQQSIGSYKTELAALSLWLLSLVIAVIITSKKLKLI